MTSILTNTAAYAALATLRDINSNLEDTQEQISSGYRIGQAADNAAYWAISATMKSDKAALDTVGDALGLAQATVDTAYSGFDQCRELLSQIKTKLLAAQQSGVDAGKVGKEITELKNQLITVAQSAAFSGENWLYNASTGAAGTKAMVGSFTRGADGTVSIQTISFNTGDSVLLDKNTASRGLLTKGYSQTVNGSATTFVLLNINSNNAVNGAVEITINSATSVDTLKGMLSAVDTMFNTLVDVADTMGAVKARIDTQSAFVKNLGETLAKGIGKLVDADMNEASTRLKALQTQQQLGIQSLSIANGSAQNIMQLFRA